MRALPRLPIYLAAEPMSMQGSFDKLSGMVREQFGQDPMRDGIYVFYNRARTHLKVLWYDRSGFLIVYKRMSRGVFPIPRPVLPTDRTIEMGERELSMILDGIDHPRVLRARAPRAA
jgi:transposase